MPLVTPIINVAAAFIKKDNTILLCQRRKNDTYGLLWEFPGGKIEDRETPIQAIKREIKEELNVNINVKEYLRFFADYQDNLIIVVFLFACDIISGQPYPYECKKVQYFAWEKVPYQSLAPVDKKIYNYLYKK